ncbi:hypothetical protein ZOSMA_6G01630 [Zostera marina]|uniref:DUF4378 domain-containing protein n=1 Tax=Zostera marina TaxID=29655 RepID=A0A0K9NTG2_ZOSMR|nr:hypothetical protein ZOSMA_6G01630 [Zostera marina]
MGRRSHGKGSISPDSRSHRRGVMGGVIHFFDFRRMLSVIRHRSHEDSVGDNPTLTVNGRKGRRRSKEASSSIPQLTRTLSIHYLECNDYVLNDGEVIVSPKPTVVANDPVAELQITKDEEFYSTRRELFLKLIHDDEKNNSNENSMETPRTEDVGVGAGADDRRMTGEEKKKQKHRISMDRFLHKIPYGQKISDGIRVEKAGITGGGFKRSRSLTESVNRYSLFMESTNTQSLLPRSISAREYGPFPAMNRSKTLGSSPNFPSFREFVEEKSEIKGLVTIGEEESQSDTIEVKSEKLEDRNEFTENEIQEFHPMHLRVESQDRPEFNYVRELLLKSGLNTIDEASPETWNSPDQPVDFALFEELEGVKCKIDFGLYAPDINLDHLLLFDLINQVLLDTYSSNHLSSWFKPRRLVATEASVLEEVWAKINWHRSYNLKKLNNSIDQILTRDFSRDDGWMEFALDSQILGEEIQGLIFDDLLNEFIMMM